MGSDTCCAFQQQQITAPFSLAVLLGRAVSSCRPAEMPLWLCTWNLCLPGVQGQYLQSQCKEHARQPGWQQQHDALAVLAAGQQTSFCSQKRMPVTLISWCLTCSGTNAGASRSPGPSRQCRGPQGVLQPLSEQCKMAPDGTPVLLKLAAGMPLPNEQTACLAVWYVYVLPNKGGKCCL